MGCRGWERVPRASRRTRTRRRALVLVAAAGALAGCAGENLFTPLPVTGGDVGMEVDITAPAASFAVAIGDSVQITVNLTSSAGVDVVVFSGVSSANAAEPGFVRFVEETVDLPSPTDTTLVNFLRATADATVEDVDLIVEATDLLGDVDADTVTIRVGS